MDEQEKEVLNNLLKRVDNFKRDMEKLGVKVIITAHIEGDKEDDTGMV